MEKLEIIVRDYHEDMDVMDIYEGYDNNAVGDCEIHLGSSACKGLFASDFLRETTFKSIKRPIVKVNCN